MRRPGDDDPLLEELHRLLIHARRRFGPSSSASDASRHELIGLIADLGMVRERLAGASAELKAEIDAAFRRKQAVEAYRHSGHIGGLAASGRW